MPLCDEEIYENVSQMITHFGKKRQNNTEVRKKDKRKEKGKGKGGGREKGKRKEKCKGVKIGSHVRIGMDTNNVEERKKV